MFHVILNIFLHNYYRTVIQSSFKNYRRKDTGTENNNYANSVWVLKLVFWFRHQAYADGDHLLSVNISDRKITEALLDTSKDADVDVSM
jgi:hypothetical protein